MVVAALAAVVATAHAEVIGPLLPRTTVSLGVQERWVKRTVYYQGAGHDIEQAEGAIVGRWGITDFATLSFELSPGIYGQFTDDLGEVKQFYLVGGGIQAAVWRHDRLTVSVAYQYTADLFRIDATNPNLSTATFGGQLVAQREEFLQGQSLTWFAGPAYSVHTVTEEHGAQNSERTYYTDSNFGGVLGANLLLWKHLNLTGHLLWVENLQPRYGVEYRF